VLATDKILGLVLYTGKETKSALNSKQPRTKVGKFDEEVNFLSKILFLMMVMLAFVIEILHGFDRYWFIQVFRYLLLLSSIIPISLRVNIDFAKAYYTFSINRDKKYIPDTIVRNSSIPEELGRINILLSDKTGTLTQNEMVFKKIVVNEVQYSSEKFLEI